MSSSPAAAQRQYAVEIVERLKNAGYEALWAGGCVRDQLRGETPHDYDIATSAEPNQVREVFGHRRTLPLGAAFGVITVVGTKQTGNVEVATFRRDATYSDGRHPDSVAFSTAEHDALRRDFSVNGLFFDPLANRVIDYVGGQQDLEQRLIRAIGNPHERFEEDKLRMLRAIRFATVLEFEIEPDTLRAITQRATELVIVSAERIAAELRKMLCHRHRRRAVTLLAETGLLEVILPESSPELVGLASKNPAEHEVWNRTCRSLHALSVESFPVALALLLRGMVSSDTLPKTLAGEVAARLKLSNEEAHIAQWLMQHEATLRQAPQLPWPQIQRLLVEQVSCWVPPYLAALATADVSLEPAARFCAEKLALPPAQLNPEPLISGDDLIRIGLRSGPYFKPLLEEVRDRQLLGLMHTSEEALAYAQDIATDSSS